MDVDRYWEVQEQLSVREDWPLICADEDVFYAFFDRIQAYLERGDFRFARPIDETGVYWLMKTLAFHDLETGYKVPQLLVSFEIMKRPPGGLIGVRRVVTVADVEAGLHAGFLTGA